MRSARSAGEPCTDKGTPSRPRGIDAEKLICVRGPSYTRGSSSPSDGRRIRRTYIPTSYEVQLGFVGRLVSVVFLIPLIMFQEILSALLRHWPLVLPAAIFLWLAKNYFHHGLHHFPGPFAASLTDWWRLFDVWGRRPDVTHRALHDEYGEFVRLGPNCISIADPKALKTIYGLNKGFIKVRGTGRLSKFTC